VCELDIIFNCEKVHWVIDEMIVGGLVVETSPSAILEVIEAQAKLMHGQTELGAAAATAARQIDSVMKGLPPRPNF
jgi:AP-3 complex subunit sigma